MLSLGSVVDVGQQRDSGKKTQDPTEFTPGIVIMQEHVLECIEPVGSVP